MIPEINKHCLFRQVFNHTTNRKFQKPGKAQKQNELIRTARILICLLKILIVLYIYIIIYIVYILYKSFLI